MAGTAAGLRLTVDDLVDRAEITDLFVRYCTALRTQDLSLLDGVFTADAVIDYTRLGGLRTGVEETKAWLSALLTGVEEFLLTVGDCSFDMAPDRRTASVTTTWHGLFVPRGEGPALQVYGHYEDRLVRAAAGWSIAERVDHPTARMVATVAPTDDGSQG